MEAVDITESIVDITDSIVDIESQECTTPIKISSPELSDENENDDSSRFQLEADLREILERHEQAIVENPEEDANYESSDAAEYDEDARVEIHAFCTTTVDKSRALQIGLYVMATHEEFETWQTKSEHKLRNIIAERLRQATRPWKSGDSQQWMERNMIVQALHNVQFAMQMQLRAMFKDAYDQLSPEQLSFINTPDQVIVYTAAEVPGVLGEPDPEDFPITLQKIIKMIDAGEIDHALELLRMEFRPSFAALDAHPLVPRVTRILQKIGQEMIIAQKPRNNHRRKVKRPGATIKPDIKN